LSVNQINQQEIIIMFKSIGVKSLGITIPLACDFTEQQCHDLMARDYPGVTDYELIESYVQNDSCNW
jgi:hypothetical protein